MKKRNNHNVKKPRRSPQSAAERVINRPAKNDPGGSYTGLPLDPDGRPEQDGDDL